MKAATIVPQNYLHLVAHQPYHLALAHLVGKEGFGHYTNFYRNIGHDPEKFLILDNGLIEGDPRPIEELVNKAAFLHADELVLPDVFQDLMGTLKASYDALNYVRKKSTVRVMAVPQGSTYENWLICAKEMLEWDIDTLAIPKVVTKMAGRDGRLHALQDLHDLLEKKKVDVHLLGCWESPLELKYIESFVKTGEAYPVRGVDSAIAYVYARAGLRMSEAERPPGAIDFDARDADEELLKYNIEMWQSECGALENQQPRIW